MITSKQYHDEKYFDHEVSSIFSGWLFVGMESELQNANDFVTLDVGRHAIVVQNFRGTIRAFKNICLHRFSKIQLLRKGNRPFFCSYHGWSYNQNGEALVGSRFKQDGEKADNLKLDEYPLEKCGSFYFVNTSNDQQSLNDFLGDYYRILQSFSEYLGKELYNDEMPHNANWKLLIENVLECYHCKTIHAETFIPMGIGSLPATNFRNYNKHNDCEYPKKEAEQLNVKEGKLSFLKYRRLKHTSYHHHFIYPNLFVSSTEGNVFYVGNLVPLSGGKTNLIVRVYAPVIDQPSDVKVNTFLINAFSEASVQSTLNVLMEDKVILENIQEVIGKIDREPIFGKEEFRIEHFYTNYFQDIHAQQ